MPTNSAFRATVKEEKMCKQVHIGKGGVSSGHHAFYILFCVNLIIIFVIIFACIKKLDFIIYVCILVVCRCLMITI